ncbi:MAG: asparagine--tRNA ligase [Aigarchaeota archaeon]|nr:asparagine--tRNA ligase [Candidatus Pelearchaeum maunauluense]
MVKTLFVKDVFGLAGGSRVELLGWVRNRRLHGKLVFLDVRDSTGVIQVAVKVGVASGSAYENAVRVGREAAVRVVGEAVKDPRAPGGVEIACRELEVVGEALEEFPIKPGVGARFLHDHRHLHLRSPKVSAVMRVRAKLLDAARRWFEENGFVEIHCPTFITAAVEGGATLFKVDYFGREAYLTQSVQFYQEAAIYGLEKVYSIQPSFRAEKSKTRRHLTEFWHVEAELAHAGLEDLMKVVEGLVSFSVREAVERSAEELRTIGRSFNTSSVEPPFERIKYAEALELLESRGVSLEWGSDLGADEERILTQQFEKPFFVTHYPKEAKAFYHMPDPRDGRVTLSADLLAPQGYGEIVGGGQRIHDYNQLLERIREEGLNPEEYKWYLDLRKYGSVPHSGFGLGVERLLQWVLGLRSVRSACLFPRTRARLYP